MDVKTGHKKTELGVIPEDWEVKSIGEISNPVRGGSPRPAGDPKYFNGSFISWLTVAALTNIPISQLYVFKTDSNLTVEGSFYSRILEKGTLIIANSGATLGVAKILAIKCCANDGIAALLDVNKDISKEYLVFFINSRIKYLREVVATGNGQPNLNTGLIRIFKVPLPPTKAEQTAIATALSDADALITSLEKLIAKKHNIKQGAMQKLLQPKEGWEVKKLGDLFEVTSSKRVFQSEWTSEGIPFYRARELAVLGENGFVNNELFITNEMYKEFKSQHGVPEIGDMLVTGVGTLGKTFVVSNNNKFYFKDGNIIWFKIKNSINSIFLQQLFSTQLVRKQIDDGSAGTTVGTYTINGAKKTVIPFPPIEEQTRIATILSDMDNEINALETKLEKYKMIKLGMMQNLLTGKIRLV